MIGRKGENMKKIRFIQIVMCCMLLVMAACTDDLNTGSGSMGSANTGKVRFAASVVNGGTVTVGTRALTDSEDKVEKLTLLYFTQKNGKDSPWTLRSYETITNIEEEGTGSSKKFVFDATVPKDEATYKLVMIEFFANFDFDSYEWKDIPKGKFLENMVGQNVNDIMERIYDSTKLNELTAAGEEQGQPLVMWGYQAAMDYSDNAKINEVHLIRDAAKMVINNQAGENFRLQKVSLYNPLDQARVAPYVPRGENDNITPQCPIDAPEWEKYDQETVAGHPSDPNVASVSKDPYETGEYEDGHTGFVLYCYPRENTENGVYWDEKAQENKPLDRDHRLYLILQGEYNYEGNWVPGYYRVDIARIDRDKITNKLKTFKLIDIYRKYQYNINITQVTGPGYDSPEAAAAAPTSDLILMDVTQITNEDAKDVISNGQYRLGLTEKQVFYNTENGWTTEEKVEVSRIFLTSLLTETTVKDIEGNAATEELGATFPKLVTSDGKANVNTGSNDAIKVEVLSQIGNPIFDGQTVDSAEGLSFEYVQNNEDSKKSYVAIYMNKRNAFTSSGGEENPTASRTVVLSVTAGNLKRNITIYQGEKGRFKFGDSLPDGEGIPSYYVSWTNGTELVIPVTISDNTLIPEIGLQCEVNIQYQASTGFVNYTDQVKEVVVFTENEKIQYIKLKVNSAYYGMNEAVYRVNKVAITAQGMEDGIFAIKQSKYMDGVFGDAVVGIHRNNTNTDSHTLDFGNVEQKWSATVIQGEDFIKLEGVGSDAEITGKGEMTFSYHLEENTGTDDRYGRILLKYGNIDSDYCSTHTIYVHQGLQDVQLTNSSGTVVSTWMAHNIDPATISSGAKSDFVSNPGYPGIMFKFGNRDDWYYGGGEWGKDYNTVFQDMSAGDKTKLQNLGFKITWSETGGSNPQSYTTSGWPSTTTYDWNRNQNPCPNGYHVARKTDWEHLTFEITGTTIGTEKLADIPNGNITNNAQKYFTRVVWGKVTNGKASDFRAGLLYIKEADNGDVISTLFIPACGVLSQTFTSGGTWQSGVPRVSGNGKLLYTWYNPTFTEADHYGNQGGGYWMVNTTTNSVDGDTYIADIYHDSNNAIGLTNKSSSDYNYTINDALPVRCVKDTN